MSDKEYTPVIGGETTYIRPKQLAEQNFSGVLLEGIYEGTVPDNYDNSKNNFKFTDLNGKSVIINGTGSLAKQLSNVDEGAAVQIEYKGMQKIEKGKMAGKQAHAWVVGVAND